jgi:methyl-accepting chemotaxis protein
MGSLALLDRIICFLGILVGVFGIIFSIYMFLVIGDGVDAIHGSAIGQVDSAISILADARGIVSATADSMNSLTSFAKNSSDTLNQTADSLSSMGTAVSFLAVSLGQVPYMPDEATGPLESAAQGLSGTAQDMKGTAASMAGVTDNALSTASGVAAMDEDIAKSITSLEETKKQIDGIHGTVRFCLLLGTILAVLMFGLNGLSFYRQLRG